MNPAIRVKLVRDDVSGVRDLWRMAAASGSVPRQRSISISATEQQSWVFNAFAIASLTGMFFGGQLADRYFAQEKFLAFSHLIGGLADARPGLSEDFWPFFRLDAPALFLLCADACRSPMRSRLPTSRMPRKTSVSSGVWGTIGWIAAAGRSSSFRSTGRRCRRWIRRAGSLPGSERSLRRRSRPAGDGTASLAAPSPSPGSLRSSWRRSA